MSVTSPLDRLLIRRAHEPWSQRHNDAVETFLRGQRTPDDERSILTLAVGIAEWCDVHDPDGYTRSNIMQPLFEAFRAALNHNLGRLDAGTLDGWASDRLTALDMDPDTYEWLSTAAN